MFPEKMMPLFIANLMEDKKVPVYGDGMQVRDWIHVTDHARGVDAILQKGKIGDTYCLGGNCEVPNIFIVKKLLELLGKDESYIEYVKDRPGHDRRYAIDFTRAIDNTPLQENVYYNFSPDSGFFVAHEGWLGAEIQNQHQNSAIVKYVLRKTIDYVLDGKILQSRALLMEWLQQSNSK